MDTLPTAIIRHPALCSQEAYGRPSFNQMLQRIAKVWQSKQAEIEEQSADTMRQLQEATQAAGDRSCRPRPPCIGLWRKADL